MSKNPAATPTSFEDAMRQLEQIVSDIESGRVGLEESLGKYERGQFLIKHCREILQRAEKQIEELAADKIEAAEETE